MVDRPQEIENDAAMSFFGGQSAMRMRVRDRPHSKAPDRVRGMCCFLFEGVCVNQAAAAVTFFALISSSARSQSSSSWPSSLPHSW